MTQMNPSHKATMVASAPPITVTQGSKSQIQTGCGSRSSTTNTVTKPIATGTKTRNAIDITEVHPRICICAPTRINSP